MKDWELSPLKLIKRIAGWKDITLLNKLAAYGYQHYSPKNKKRIRQGQTNIPEKTRKQLEHKYANLAKQPPPERKRKTRKIGGSYKSGWMTIESYVASIAKPGLDIEFSIARLKTRNIHYAYVKNGIPTFCNKRLSDAPQQDIPVPQTVVYLIEVEDYEGIASWLQGSESVYYGANPLGREERQAAEEEVSFMEERNQEMAQSKIPSKEIYVWWNQGADKAHYTFIGIGVYVV